MEVEHRVPLPARAVEILREMRRDRAPSRFPFHGVRPREPMSDRTLFAVLRRWKIAVTVHGFRSSFADWRNDATTFPPDLAEAALAHAVGDATERAYRRSDALEKRRELMDAWGRFLDGAKGAEIVRLADRRG